MEGLGFGVFGLAPSLPNHVQHYSAYQDAPSSLGTNSLPCTPEGRPDGLADSSLLWMQSCQRQSKRRFYQCDEGLSVSKRRVASGPCYAPSLRADATVQQTVHSECQVFVACAQQGAAAWQPPVYCGGPVAEGVLASSRGLAQGFLPASNIRFAVGSRPEVQGLVYGHSGDSTFEQLQPPHQLWRSNSSTSSLSLRQLAATAGAPSGGQQLAVATVQSSNQFAFLRDGPQLQPQSFTQHNAHPQQLYLQQHQQAQQARPAFHVITTPELQVRPAGHVTWPEPPYPPTRSQQHCHRPCCSHPALHLVTLAGPVGPPQGHGPPRLEPLLLQQVSGPLPGALLELQAFNPQLIMQAYEVHHHHSHDHHHHHHLQAPELYQQPYRQVYGYEYGYPQQYDQRRRSLELPAHSPPVRPGTPLPPLSAPLDSSPEEWILYACKALNLSIPTTARLALHLWRRIHGLVLLLASVRPHRSAAHTAARGPAAAAGNCNGSTQRATGLIPMALAAPMSMSMPLPPVPPMPLPPATPLTPRAGGRGSSGGAAASAERAYSMACVWVSAKLEEQRRDVPHVGFLAHLVGTGPGVLVAMEVRVLEWCGWSPYNGYLPDDAHLLVDM